MFNVVLKAFIFNFHFLLFDYGVSLAFYRKKTEVK